MFWKVRLRLRLRYPGTMEPADFWKVRLRYPGGVELAAF